MLPIGMPNLALISAYGTGGSWASKVTSCSLKAGRSPNAWRSAA